MDVANSYLLRSCKNSLQNTLYFGLGKKDKISEFWKLDTDHELFIVVYCSSDSRLRQGQVIVFGQDGWIIF